MAKEKEKAHPLLRAWAAGVFDAKASFPKSGFVLRFDSVNEQVMRKFYDAVGQLGHLKQHDRKDIALARPIWIFQTQSTDDTRELLLLLSPFLSAQRVKQAADLIGRIERSTVWQKKNPEKAKKLVVVEPKAGSSDTDPA